MGSAMAEPCYVCIVRSEYVEPGWLRIRSWHTNRDSAGVRFNKEGLNPEPTDSGILPQPTTVAMLLKTIVFIGIYIGVL